ncbi:SpoIIE family protein phosphatase [Microbispora amethystogenes]|nr:SpoIIE family protein phosphatase [Microbispora amethystogenes]
MDDRCGDSDHCARSSHPAGAHMNLGRFLRRRTSRAANPSEEENAMVEPATHVAGSLEDVEPAVAAPIADTDPDLQDDPPPKNETAPQEHDPSPGEPPTDDSLEEPDIDTWGDFFEGADDLEVYDEGFVSVLVPKISLEWPASLASTLAEAVSEGGSDGLNPDAIVPALPALWRVVADAVHLVGFGCLTRESVRWGSGTWQLILSPRYSLTGTVLEAGHHDEHFHRWAWLQDRHVIAYALVEAVVGRRPAGRQDAQALVECAAGEVTPGFDAIVDLLLEGDLAVGDLRALQALDQLLSRNATNPVRYRCFRETMTGSGKASGRAEDNEDLAWWMSVKGKPTCLALMDGITGNHDGWGRKAVLAAMSAIRGAWESGTLDPAEAIAVADREVCARTPPGGATAILGSLSPDGTGQLASVGDSAAWQLRPDDPVNPKHYQAWRLTPVHTEYAENLRADATVVKGKSSLTRYLGGAARRPFTLTFSLAPGDLLVLLSDGAAEEEEPGRWFGGVLAKLAAARARAGRAVAPGLAADIVMRAERLGGHDNATALVVETDWADPDEETTVERAADYR